MAAKKRKRQRSKSTKRMERRGLVGAAMIGGATGALGATHATYSFNGRQVSTRNTTVWQDKRLTGVMRKRRDKLGTHYGSSITNVTPSRGVPPLGGAVVGAVGGAASGAAAYRAALAKGRKVRAQRSGGGARGGGRRQRRDSHGRFA